MAGATRGTAVVTGSASGIGAAVRERLETDGDRVVGVDLRGQEVEADLSTPEGRTAAIDGVLAATGGAIDRLVLCAGVGSHLTDLALIPSVNYFGTFALLDGLRDALAGRPDAAAVVIASNSAQMGGFDEHPYVQAMLAGDEPLARERIASENGFLAYAGSKHAVARGVRRRADAFGKAGVRLNAVAPGPTETPMVEATRQHPAFGAAMNAMPIPLGRFAAPREIAQAIAFLLGPEASYVHGVVLYADGGNDAVLRPDRF